MEPDYKAHLQRLEAEREQLVSQLRGFNYVAVALAAASLVGGVYSWVIPVAGIGLALSLAAVAFYIGTVHLQSTRERIDDLRATMAPAASNQGED